MTVSNDNQLAVLVKDSGLDQTKAQVLLTKFQGFFETAAEWEAKSKAITITGANCYTDQGKLDMKQARDGRLFLRDRRIEVENARKELKEASLREGQVIDGIAKVLKGLILPLEDHLSKQEHYLELKAAAEAERILQEQRERAEAAQAEREREEEDARVAEEKRLHNENEQLRLEAAKREKKMAAERRAADKKAEAEREKSRKEREKAAKDAETERERLMKVIESPIECPHCGKSFKI